MNDKTNVEIMNTKLRNIYCKDLYLIDSGRVIHGHSMSKAIIESTLTYFWISILFPCVYKFCVMLDQKTATTKTTAIFSET